jgi:hypothetical protein
MPRFVGQQLLLVAAALLHNLAPATAQLSCLTRLTHIHYESVAAIDMVNILARRDAHAASPTLTYSSFDPTGIGWIEA